MPVTQREVYKVGEYRVVIQKGMFMWNARIYYFHASRLLKATEPRVDRKDAVEDAVNYLRIPYREWKTIPDNGEVRNG